MLQFQMIGKTNCCYLCLLPKWAHAPPLGVCCWCFCKKQPSHYTADGDGGMQVAKDEGEVSMCEVYDLLGAAVAFAVFAIAVVTAVELC